MKAEEIIQGLAAGLKKYDVDGCLDLAKKALEADIDPAPVIDGLTSAIREVGEAFKNQEIFLPELMMAANVMKAVMPIFEEELLKKGRKREAAGNLVIGTVKGDIHDIGKSMVSTMFVASGWEVHDIGIDVPAEKFVEAVGKYQPNVLGLSALLTLSSYEMLNVMFALQQKGVRDKVKILVGGGAITPDFAKAIGADGYGADAAGAVTEAARLIGRGKEAVS